MTEAEIKELQEQNYKNRVEKEQLESMNQRMKAENQELADKCRYLESQNVTLQMEKEDLERRIDNLHKRFAMAEHEKRLAKSDSHNIKCLRDQVCSYGQKLEKTTTELKHVKRLLFERNRRYQEDCITINQLNTTIDVLISRLARKMGV